MTEVRCFLYVFARFEHIVAGILAHSSMQICSRADVLRLSDFQLPPQILCWIEVWLGHSRTLKCSLRSHSFVGQVVCLGSLSCWKIQQHFIFNALTDGRRFLPKISRYMAPLILSLIWISCPVPFAEKQPQNMMFPLPCFTVSMMFLGYNSAFFPLQTW